MALSSPRPTPPGASADAPAPHTHVGKLSRHQLGQTLAQRTGVHASERHAARGTASHGYPLRWPQGALACPGTGPRAGAPALPPRPGKLLLLRGAALESRAQAPEPLAPVQDAAPTCKPGQGTSCGGGQYKGTLVPAEAQSGPPPRVCAQVNTRVSIPGWKARPDTSGECGIGRPPLAHRGGEPTSQPHRRTPRRGRPAPGSHPAPTPVRDPRRAGRGAASPGSRPCNELRVRPDGPHPSGSQCTPAAPGHGRPQPRPLPVTSCSSRDPEAGRERSHGAGGDPGVDDASLTPLQDVGVEEAAAPVGPWAVQRRKRVAGAGRRRGGHPGGAGRGRGPRLAERAGRQQGRAEAARRSCCSRASRRRLLERTAGLPHVAHLEQARRAESGREARPPPGEPGVGGAAPRELHRPDTAMPPGRGPGAAVAAGGDAPSSPGGPGELQPRGRPRPCCDLGVSLRCHSGSEVNSPFGLWSPRRREGEGRAGPAIAQRTTCREKPGRLSRGVAARHREVSPGRGPHRTGVPATLAPGPGAPGPAGAAEGLRQGGPPQRLLVGAARPTGCGDPLGAGPVLPTLATGLGPVRVPGPHTKALASVLAPAWALVAGPGGLPCVGPSGAKPGTGRRGPQTLLPATRASSPGPESLARAQALRVTPGLAGWLQEATTTAPTPKLQRAPHPPPPGPPSPRARPAPLPTHPHAAPVPHARSTDRLGVHAPTDPQIALGSTHLSPTDPQIHRSPRGPRARAPQIHRLPQGPRTRTPQNHRSPRGPRAPQIASGSTHPHPTEPQIASGSTHLRPTEPQIASGSTCPTDPQIASGSTHPTDPQIASGSTHPTDPQIASGSTHPTDPQIASGSMCPGPTDHLGVHAPHRSTDHLRIHAPHRSTDPQIASGSTRPTDPQIASGSTRPHPTDRLGVHAPAPQQRVAPERTRGVGISSFLSVGKDTPGSLGHDAHEHLNPRRGPAPHLCLDILPPPPSKRSPQKLEERRTPHVRSSMCKGPEADFTCTGAEAGCRQEPAEASPRKSLGKPISILLSSFAGLLSPEETGGSTPPLWVGAFVTTTRGLAALSPVLAHREAVISS
ncbi:collagen alpha-1(I) chain-like [Perognathus longimembris pacificus]|uniref:collagen alpha-1(I) chain-like n=1 Tax=Perognathus longimembris pacificus TaxID=214514 RepID=UPI00201960A2|nr:collagen alpha-1(I) chain-like [Perognathus longimembris pacificus]